MSDSGTECQSSIVQEVSAYFLIVTSLIILTLVIALHWKDIYNFFIGIFRHKEQNTTDAPESPTSNQSTEKVQFPDGPLPSQDFSQSVKQPAPVIFQQPPVIFTAVPTVSNVSPASPPPDFSLKTIPELPTKEVDEALSPHESTGSRYFKHMMRGKKQVASISQYKLLKKKHKKHEKTGTKRHTHPHKHQRITREEVQKFAKEAKALAKGLP